MVDLSSVGREILALAELQRQMESQAQYWANKERLATDQRIKWEAAKREIDAKISNYIKEAKYANQRYY